MRSRRDIGDPRHVCLGLAVPLVVFGMIWPAPLPAPPDRDYDFDCHDSGECLTEASIPRPARPVRVRVAAVATTSVTVSWRRARSRRGTGYEGVPKGARGAGGPGHRFTCAPPAPP